MKIVSKIKERYHRVTKLLLSDIWSVEGLESISLPSTIIEYIKVFLITLEEFATHKISLQAIALSFFSAMSVAPFVAISFAVTNGFGLGVRLEELLYTYFEGNEEIIAYIVTFANNIVSRGQNGLFGAISLLFLLSTIVWLMLQIERAFNEIWKVESGRSFKKRAIYYFTLLLVAPLVIFLFLSLSLVYTNLLDSLTIKLKIISPLFNLLSWVTAYLFTAAVFTIMYKFIPNIKVKFSAALKSGSILSFAFIVVQFLYLKTQIMVTGLSAVYGVFAAIPLFMVWMNISWTLILFGAELSQAFQNVDNYNRI
ncbi:MAG: YihY/virulence factor BrkB family protein [Bacteroidales bacterium]